MMMIITAISRRSAANGVDFFCHVSTSVNAASNCLTYSVESLRKGASFFMMSPIRSSFSLTIRKDTRSFHVYVDEMS